MDAHVPQRSRLGRLSLVLAVVACRAQPAAQEHGSEYRNAQCFDGDKFGSCTLYVVGDRFVAKRPARVDASIDVQGGFVVPPYGEGHNHWLEATLADAYIATHLRDGIFYVKDQLTPPATHDALRDKVNTPTSVDYIAAHQGFTGPGGHPMELIDSLVQLKVLPASYAAAHGDGDALFVVETEGDVDRVWRRLMTGRPDFVKLFLVHSEEYAKRRDDKSLDPKQRGMDPALAPALVKRAHAAKLRVSAHIETAADFHTAITAGVDEIAHMPFVEAADAERYRLAQADVDAAGARKLTIATTLDFAGDAKPGDPILEVTRDNLTRLRKAGVTIAIGTDLFRTTAKVEVERIAKLGLMTNVELLRAWSIDTPRSIFPARDLGRLVPGAEASFLVLTADPLADAKNLHAIKLRVKQGKQLEPSNATLPPLD